MGVCLDPFSPGKAVTFISFTIIADNRQTLPTPYRSGELPISQLVLLIAVLVFIENNTSSVISEASGNIQSMNDYRQSVS